MFRYRTLLVDTDRERERPLQAHFMSLKLAEEWAGLVLPGASEHAYVQFYRISEAEILRVTRKELCDQSTIAALQPAQEEAGEPGPPDRGDQ